MGIGMGLVMFALLITVQNSVSRGQLGIATSLNQFSRSIGQTVGVAVMGTVMTISLASHIAEIQKESGLPEADVARTVHNPSALIDPIAAGHFVEPSSFRNSDNALSSTSSPTGVPVPCPSNNATVRIS